MIVFAQDIVFGGDACSFKTFKDVRHVLHHIPLVIIKEKGKMTMLVIRDLGITYYFQKMCILRVNNESSA